MAMWWKRLPEPCAKCQALLAYSAAARPRAAGKKDGHAPHGPGARAALAPHDDLELLSALNYFDDGGVELYRCRRCGSWWEFTWPGWWEPTSPAGESARSCRRVRVTSAEQWRRRARSAGSTGLRLMVVLFLGVPSLLLVLMRLYAVAVPSADPTFRGPNPWLGLALALSVLGGVILFYARLSRSP
jgi:hypothetical protein